MKKALGFAVLLLVVFVLASCAAGSNELRDSPNPDGVVAGFWRGLWHGIIAPVTFIISLFSRSVQMYEVHNNGGWYNFGFLVGIMIIFGGGGGASSRGRRR